MASEKPTIYYVNQIECNPKLFKMYPTLTKLFKNVFKIFTLGDASLLWAVTLLLNIKILKRQDIDQYLFFFLNCLEN